MNANNRSNEGPPRAALLRLFVIALLFAFAAGCKSRSDLVEAELRGREREVSQLRSDLQRSEIMNRALETELRMRHGAALPFPPGGEIIDRPLALMANTVQRIEIGRGTGGLDEDKWPGDEALQVVITPRDGEGSALKVPGHLVIKVFEVSIEGLKIPMGKWDIGSADLQKTWRGGVFASGYFVTLPWRNWPNSEKLRVVAQFATLPDNRWFEADKDVTIRMMPGGRPGVVPVLPSGSVPIGPPGSMPLPPGGEPLPPPVEGPHLPPMTQASPGAPAAKLSAARVAAPIEERMQQRLEAAKPALRTSPALIRSLALPAQDQPGSSPPRIEAPPGLPSDSRDSLRIEAPPLVAEPVAPAAQPARLLPPLP